MGADTSLPPTPTPDGGGGGGNTPPPPSVGSGGDSSASGGSGCGYIKDNNGKGQKAKGEGVMLMILLFFLLFLFRIGRLRYLLLLFLNFVLALIFAVPALAVEPMCPGGSSPDSNVIWCDDFEDGTALDGGWSWSNCCDSNGDGTVSSAEKNPVTCGNKGYGDNCSAWNEKFIFDNEWGYQGHFGSNTLPLPDEFYTRWYVYISNPYIWGNVEDKNLRFRAYNNDGSSVIISMTIAINRNGTGKPAFYTWTPLDKMYYQNQGNDIILQPGNWYLFEFYLKINTPGIENGVAKLWVDNATTPITKQTLRLSYNNVLFRNTNDLPTSLGLVDYHQQNAPDSSQYLRWDNIVVSKNPIGPMGGSGGNAPPPSSGNSGGGSGCGYIKDNNGKGQGAKGEGLSLMIMLIMTLCLLPIVRRLYKTFSRPVL